MNMSKQKRLTNSFFNQVASEWYERTYDPTHTYRKFPSNRIRMEVALGEIAKLDLTGRFLDVGCGTGELVIELLRRGHRVTGIDIAERMIERARANLIRSGLGAKPEATFIVSDLARFAPGNEKYQAAVALGLLEYLDTDVELFSFLRQRVVRGGHALVECRNRFFNLFSANRYTAELARGRNFSKLLREFEATARYSPLAARDIPRIHSRVSRDIHAFLLRTGRSKAWFEKARPSYSPYPRGMTRRQHTPSALASSAQHYGFRLRHVVYWHAHPYPPRYESSFPRIYNKLAVLMAPLGYTPLGAWLCSSFLAVLKRQP